MSFLVPLRFAGQLTSAELRELTGADEQSVENAGTAAAIALLDRVLVRKSEDYTSSKFTAADRDQLLAAIYRNAFGDRISSTARCRFCDALFDLMFSVSDLAQTINQDQPRVDRASDGSFTGLAGIRFRLPTGEDELAVATMSPEDAEIELMSRCVHMPCDPSKWGEVQEVMQEVAPVLDLDLKAKCPECGRQQDVHFDVQSYLLQSLRNERMQLAKEIHRIARAYGWSLQEILGLRRSQRRNFVELIENEFTGRQRGAA
jgi:hypothetical protein